MIISGSDQITNKASDKALSANDARNADTAKKFESMVIAQLLKPMFEGLETDAQFGGGAGEAAFRSFYIDAIAEEMTQKGGIGLAPYIKASLLQRQGGP
jgi:peptidoglycan hydrolase FlgJ